MSVSELKLCPFCGGEPEIHYNLVSCSTCLCRMPDGFGYEGDPLGFETEQQAIIAWNTRANEPQSLLHQALQLPEIRSPLALLQRIAYEIHRSIAFEDENDCLEERALLRKIKEALGPLLKETSP